MQNLSNQLRFYYNSTGSRPMSSFSTECSIMVPHERKMSYPSQFMVDTYFRFDSY